MRMRGDGSGALTEQIPVIRPYGPPLHIVPQSTVEVHDYTGYYRVIIILLVCVLTTLTALTVVSFWGADQNAQMNQLQQCMSRINPDANTNYQLETYKCMNGK